MIMIFVFESADPIDNKFVLGLNLCHLYRMPWSGSAVRVLTIFKKKTTLKNLIPWFASNFHMYVNSFNNDIAVYIYWYLCFQISYIEQNDIIEVDPDTKEMLKALVRILLFYHLWSLYTI